MKYTCQRIAVIGNSVALRVRNSLTDKEGLTYVDLIKEKLNKNIDERWIVNNFSLSRLLSYETVENISLYLESSFDYVLINVGCVDAPPREIPLWFSDIIFKRKSTSLYPISNLVYTGIIKKYLRNFLLKLRKYKPWVGAENFRHYMHILIDSLQLQSKAKIIVIGINPGNQHLEEALPGTLKNYQLYNNILKEICRESGVAFIDVTGFDPDKDTPDGVHYSQSGHEKLCFNVLREMGH